VTFANIFIFSDCGQVIQVKQEQQWGWDWPLRHRLATDETSGHPVTLTDIYQWDNSRTILFMFCAVNPKTFKF
jgi:hypothetical protein